MRVAVAVVVAALTLAAPAHGYYPDGGSGGNRPDCTSQNVGNGFGNWVCAADPFTGTTDWEWG